VIAGKSLSESARKSNIFSSLIIEGSSSFWIRANDAALARKVRALVLPTILLPTVFCGEWRAACRLRTRLLLRPEPKNYAGGDTGIHRGIRTEACDQKVQLNRADGAALASNPVQATTYIHGKRGV
jgi:hypothetical protein